MGITIKSNTDTVLEVLSLAGTLEPGASRTVQSVPADLLKALDLGLVVSPDGAEGPSGLPPVIFEHRHPAVLPITASRAYYVRVLRSPGEFHDGVALRNFLT